MPIGFRDAGAWCLSLMITMSSWKYCTHLTDEAAGFGPKNKEAVYQPSS